LLIIKKMFIIFHKKTISLSLSLIYKYLYLYIYYFYIPVSSPQFPRNESLQSWIALIYESAISRAAEGQSFPEYQRMTIVKYIALAVVSRR